MNNIFLRKFYGIRGIMALEQVGQNRVFETFLNVIIFHDLSDISVMDPAEGESRNIFSERASSRRRSATEIALCAVKRSAAGVRGRSPRKIFGVFAR